MSHILVVDDEQSMGEFLQILLEREGHGVTLAGSVESALVQLEEREFDLVITDQKMPGLGGHDLLEQVKESRPETEVVMMTAYASMESAVAAMKAGAYDYLIKPFSVDAVKVVVRKALEKRALQQENIALRQELSHKYQFANIVGKSRAMERIYDLIRRVARTRTNVLISGESGTGKELVARALHYNSDRCNRAMVVMNCGAVPETLMESELFGHTKGAFTGAIANKRGLFEAAQGSSIMLDEVGELPLGLQVKLLRVLQERTVKPVGGVGELGVDVRIIAATNKDLAEEVRQGRFREDLYYRLNVIQIDLPPLRAREDDISILAAHFLRKYCQEMGKDVQGFSHRAVAALRSYGWPGNVRELENVVERAVALGLGPVVEVADLALNGVGTGPHAVVGGGESSHAMLPPPHRSGGAQGGDAGEVAGCSSDVQDDGFWVPGQVPAGGMDLEALVGDIERHLLVQALKSAGGVRKEAARLLNITFRSMRYRLDKYGIHDDEFSP